MPSGWDSFWLGLNTSPNVVWGYTGEDDFSNNNDIGNYTKGLEYKFQDGSYGVAGIGNATDKDIVIPSTYEGYPVTRIEAEAFAYNLDVKSIILPDTIISIGNKAFASCWNLESVEIKTGVVSIGDEAFSGAGMLGVYIPASVTYLGKKVFCWRSDKTINFGATEEQSSWDPDWYADCEATVVWGYMGE